MTTEMAKPAIAKPINAADLESNPLAFPIYVMDMATKLPDTGNYYIIASNGLWLHKDMGIMRGMVRVDGISHLGELQPSIGMRIPNIPEAIMLRSLIFFRKVYSKYHAESEVQLFYNKDTGRFRLFCPEQSVSYGGVHYRPDQWDDPNHNLKGFLLVGTIHSHCNFGASHSSTDHKDERYADGIHVTIGHVDAREFSLVCSMQLNHQRVQIDPTIKILGLESARPSGEGWFNNSGNNYYRLKLPLSKPDLKAIITRMEGDIEKEWMPKVRQEYFRSSYQGGYGSTYRGDHYPGRSVGLSPPSAVLDRDARDRQASVPRSDAKVHSFGDEELAPPPVREERERLGDVELVAEPLVSEEHAPSSAGEAVSFQQEVRQAKAFQQEVVSPNDRKDDSKKEEDLI